MKFYPQHKHANNQIFIEIDLVFIKISFVVWHPYHVDPMIQADLSYYWSLEIKNKNEYSNFYSMLNDYVMN